MQKQNMNWFATVPRVVICFIILKDLTEFSVEFCVDEVFKFWVKFRKTTEQGVERA